jgi:hypothetical protein
MVTHCAFGRLALTLVLLLPFVAAATEARADTAAATSCATGLPKDARAIFDATLPQLAPGGDLRAMVTANTRSLALAGKIEPDTARDSAKAAAVCLERAAT